jgi:hypothetical protein
MVSKSAFRLALLASAQMSNVQLEKFMNELDAAQEGDNQGNVLQQSDIRDLAEKVLNN